MKPKYYIEYFLVRSFTFFLRCLGRRRAQKWGEYLALSASLVLPRRQKLIRQNLSLCFPHFSQQKIGEVTRSVWKNLGRTAADFICMPAFSDENIDQFIDWKGTEHVEKALQEGKGLILVTGHLTNWEVVAWATQYRFGHLMAIARPMKNPLVEKWLRERRGIGGNQVVLHREAVRASLKWLKKKKIVGILVDQNLYTGGVFVPFFNRPAATTTLPTLLHTRTEAPVLFTYSVRKGEKYEIHYEESFQFSHEGTVDEQLQRGTQQISDYLQNLISAKPENWFWVHNRWKRQP